MNTCAHNTRARVQAFLNMTVDPPPAKIYTLQHNDKTVRTRHVPPARACASACVREIFFTGEGELCVCARARVRVVVCAGEG